MHCDGLKIQNCVAIIRESHTESLGIIVDMFYSLSRGFFYVVRGIYDEEQDHFERKRFVWNRFLRNSKCWSNQLANLIFIC